MNQLAGNSLVETLHFEQAESRDNRYYVLLTASEISFDNVLCVLFEYRW